MIIGMVIITTIKTIRRPEPALPLLLLQPLILPITLAASTGDDLTDLISIRSLSCLTLTITTRWFHPCLHRLPWSLGCGQADQGLHCWGENGDDGNGERGDDGHDVHDHDNDHDKYLEYHTNCFSISVDAVAVVIVSQ